MTADIFKKGARVKLVPRNRLPELTAQASVGKMMTRKTIALALAVRNTAATSAATVFNRSSRSRAPALPEEFPTLEDGIAQFYGAVGGVLCSTLWDPGSSVNLITPEFAKELQQRGLRWEYCKPMHIVHGVGEDGGVRAAAPAVRRIFATVVLCHQGLTYRKVGAEFYIYQGALPDVVLSKQLLKEMECLDLRCIPHELARAGIGSVQAGDIQAKA